jgi:phosphatidylglycerol:prolipoprotein diacylglycerol transferase
MAFRDFPEIVQKYGVNGVVPDTIPVHPAPLYESIYGIFLFLVLWKVRGWFTKDGQLFMLYLMLSGAARFLVEFVRVNPRILFSLSEAQVIAIVLFLAGAVGMKLISSRTSTAAAP